MTTAAPQQQRQVQRKLARILVGVVVSAKNANTRAVTVSYQSRHPKYGKYLHRQTKYHVHDPANTSKLGDRVEIAPCRPISKTKSWRLVRVVEAAQAPLAHVTEVAPDVVGAPAGGAQ